MYNNNLIMLLTNSLAELLTTLAAELALGFFDTGLGLLLKYMPSSILEPLSPTAAQRGGGHLRVIGLAQR